MKQTIQIYGHETSGSFTLNHGENTTGKIGVAYTARKVLEKLEELPGLRGNVVVTSDDDGKIVGPKAWTVEFPDELGPLFVGGRLGNSSGLTGWASPQVGLLYH